MLKEEQILFSVIVPLYNKQAEIKSTVNSVLNQTCEDFELIVVNDGSTDNSLTVLNEIEHSKLKVISKVNEGVSIARNTGIFAATGKYIALLDGDDIWHPDYLQEIKSLIDEFDNCKIFGTNYTVSDNTDIIYDQPVHKLIANYFELAMHMPFLTSSSVVIERACFNDHMQFKSKFTHGEDLDLWARLIKEYIHIGYSEKKLVYYVHSATNRACLVLPKPERHFAYYFNINEETQPEVKRYYLQQVVLIMWIYLRNLKLNYFMLFLMKHKKIATQIFYGIIKNIFHNEYKIAIKTK